MTQAEIEELKILRAWKDDITRRRLGMVKLLFPTRTARDELMSWLIKQEEKEFKKEVSVHK